MKVDWIIMTILALLSGAYLTPAALANEAICDSDFTLEEVFKPPLYSSSGEDAGEMVKISDRTIYVEHVPATFETVIETISGFDATTELIITPAVWKWVDGEFPGTSEELIIIRPEYETITQEIVISAEMTSFVERPAEYKLHKGKKYLVKAPEPVEIVVPAVKETIKRNVISKPSRIERVIRKNLIKDGRTYQIITQGSQREVTLPNKRFSVLRRVVKTPAHSVGRILNEPLYKWVPKTRTPEFDGLALRNASGTLLAHFETREDFETLKTDLTCDEMRAHYSD